MTMSPSLDKYRQKQLHRDTIAAVCYNSSGNFLVTADQSGEIRMWPSGHRAVSPYAPLSGVWCSEDDSCLLAGHQDGYLLIYDLPKLKLRAEVHLKTEMGSGGRILSGTSRPVLEWVVLATAPANSPNIYAILESRACFTIQWEGLTVTPHPHHPGALFECAAISPQGRQAFFGDELGFIYRLTIPEMKIELFAEHCEEVEAIIWSTKEKTTKVSAPGIAGLSLSQDGRRLGSTSREGGTQIWPADYPSLAGSSNPRDFQPLAARRLAGAGWMRGTCFLPGTNSLVLGADNGVLQVWDYQSGKVTDLGQCQAGVRRIAVSPDGTQIAVGCDDGILYLIPWGESGREKVTGKRGWLSKLLGR